jgi:hypothetical protein
VERTRTPSHPIEIKEDEVYQFSAEESETLNDVLAILSGKQFKAARMEAAGFDATTIASTVKIHPQSITIWRKNIDYLKARDLFLSIINKQGLKFRLDCQRQIIAPAYAELIRRMNEKRIVMSLDHKSLLDTVKVIGKETRLDSIGIGAGSEDDDLAELQKRRQDFSVAKQQEAIENIKRASNIISFPSTGTYRA